jgi:glycosyltransferase involved in cell wall biosynthesis
MKTTVILCTFNRCELLENALDSLAGSVLPSGVDWDVLVVDNNSTDRTAEVIKSFCERYPGRFRYLFEPRAGKSNALNAGIRETQCDVLAFTDDDVVVEPTWLQNLTRSLDGTCAGVGGRILPEQTFSPPNWIDLEEEHALAPLAVFAPDIAAGPMDQPPYGANMAYDRRVFAKYGGFRTDLGPQAGSKNPQKSEDSEFGQRLLAGGEQLRYEPSAVVFHTVPQYRVQKKYFLDWWYDKARADIHVRGIPVGTRVAGIPLILFRRLVMWSLRWALSLQPAKRFSCKVKVWINRGEIRECYRLSRRASADRPEASPQP